jgi:PmbA protein
MTLQDEGDRRPAGYHWVGCRYRNDLPPLQDVGKLAALRTHDLLGAKKIETKKLPVIIENRVVGQVLGGLQGPMSAGNIQQKRSFLADKKGQQIGSKLLTLQDDPFLLRGLGSKYYDGDGFPAKKRNLFTGGVLNEFLVDWYYSRKLGWEPTSGSISNLILPPGLRSADEIVKDLGNCILITGFIGGNSNSTSGDFSIGIFGKLFENGKFVQNIAEMNMADNHLKFWHKLTEVANDPWIYSSLRVPSLVFDDVVVSGI